VDVVTPDGGVDTVEAAVTDEGVAAVESTPDESAPDQSAPDQSAPADAGQPDTATDEGGTLVAAAEPATAPVEGYDDWSIAQLRGRLRGYQQKTVAELVAYEEGTRARESYLRMLRNRLEKLDEQAVEASPLAPRGV
jgi:hypothetical protein